MGNQPNSPAGSEAKLKPLFLAAYAHMLEESPTKFVEYHALLDYARSELANPDLAPLLVKCFKAALKNPVMGPTKKLKAALFHKDMMNTRDKSLLSVNLKKVMHTLERTVINPYKEY